MKNNQQRIAWWASLIALLTVLAGAGCGPSQTVEERAEDAGTTPKSVEAEPPEEIPEGMVYVPGGVTHIGAEDGLPPEQPVFEAEVASFFIDAHPVTVAQFRAFVEATVFVT